MKKSERLIDSIGKVNDKYIEEYVNSIYINKTKKASFTWRKSVASAACFVMVLFSIIAVVKSNTGLKPSPTKDQGWQASVDYSIDFFNKYELFNFAATNIKLKNERFKFTVFPEVEGQMLKKAKITPSGRVVFTEYESYSVYISKAEVKEEGHFAVDFDYKYEGYKKYRKKVELVTINDIKYIIVDDDEIYFEKDGLAIKIRLRNVKEFPGITKVLNDVKLVNYEFIGDEIARAKVYDENKTIKYVLNGKEEELSYKYSEINYVLCVEHDVYTDGTNEYMFNKDNELIGYRNNSNQSTVNHKDHIDIAKEEIGKYVDTNLYILDSEKKNADGSYYEYRQYVNGMKTNGVAKVSIDKDGNITEFFVNKSKYEGYKPSINEKLLKEQINIKVKNIYLINNYHLRLDKVGQMIYAVDESGDLVIICNVKTKILEWKQKEYTEIGEFPLMLVIKVKDCIG